MPFARLPHLVQPDGERRIEWAPRTAAFVELQASVGARSEPAPLLQPSVLSDKGSERGAASVAGGPSRRSAGD
jgi:hypothetical protein